MITSLENYECYRGLKCKGRWRFKAVWSKPCLRQHKAGYWPLTPFLPYIAVVLRHTRSSSATLRRHRPQLLRTHLIPGSSNLQSLCSDTCWFDLKRWWEDKWDELLQSAHTRYDWFSVTIRRPYHRTSPTCDTWCSPLCCAPATCMCCPLLSSGSSPYNAEHAFCRHWEELSFYSQD